MYIVQCTIIDRDIVHCTMYNYRWGHRENAKPIYCCVGSIKSELLCKTGQYKIEEEKVG